MKCVDCGKEKDIEKINMLIYEEPVCQDCADDRENMILARETEKHFEWLLRVQKKTNIGFL